MLPIIIPSFHSRELTSICIRSFLKFCPADMNLRYIVVENSNDVSYRDEVCSLSSNIVWINNHTDARGSDANAEALKIGLENVDVAEELVFMAHCDICVTDSMFLELMNEKIREDGYGAVAFLHDRARIQALHILALMVKTGIAKSSRLTPKYKNNVQVWDVGDGITQYCRDNSIKHCSMENTYNNPKLANVLEEKFQKMNNVPRCVYNDKVLCMHLGRGISKTEGSYKKPNRIYLEDWIEFCEDILK